MSGGWGWGVSGGGVGRRGEGDCFGGATVTIIPLDIVPECRRLGSIVRGPGEKKDQIGEGLCEDLVRCR